MYNFNFAFSIEFSTFRFKMKSFIVFLFFAACAVATPPTWNGILDESGNYIPGDSNLQPFRSTKRHYSTVHVWMSFFEEMFFTAVKLILHIHF